MRVLGFDPVTEGTQVRARSGVLTESPALDDRLTARMTLQLFGEIYGVPKAHRRERAEELLQLFDLSSRADDKVGGFSKGMKQRMALARTIIHQPDLIFLDEPTAALDPVATREVHTMIRNASQKGGRTVILCTHNLYEAERLCTRVAVLAKGKILAQGTPAELAAQYGSAQRILIEVDPTQIEGAMERVRTLPAAPHVERSDTSVGAFSVQGIPATEVPLLLNALVSVGVRVFQVVREQATLEDVYFALQGKEIGDA
jgi:ABC-2 type transport system ATP-binding protein